MFSVGLRDFYAHVRNVMERIEPFVISRDHQMQNGDVRTYYI